MRKPFPSFADSTTGCYQGLIANNKIPPIIRRDFIVAMPLKLYSPFGE
jgi:hypothetical protein